MTAASARTAVIAMTLLATDAAAQTSRRPLVMIMRPTTRGVTRPAETEAIVQRLTVALRELFPCARINNEYEIKQEVEAERRKQLMSETIEDGALDKIGAKYDADLVIALTLSTSGTTQNSPQRHTAMSLLDPRQTRAVERTMHSADDWDWNDKDLVPALMEDVRGSVDLCPWVGTVEYQYSYRKDTSWVIGPVAEGGDGSTRTERFRSSELIDGRWKFTLERRGLREPRLTTSGTQQRVTSDEGTVELRNTSCFVEVNGTVMDNARIANATSVVTTKIESRGHATDSLQEAALTISSVTEPSGEKSWSFSLRGLVSGKASGSATEEKRGSCGSWTRPLGGEATGILPGLTDLYGAAVDATVGFRDERGVAKGTVTYSDDGGGRTTVVWNLRRN